MKKRRLFTIFMVVFLFFIVFNFGIHAYRTRQFNNRIHLLENGNSDENCSFQIAPQNGNAISWTRTATIDGQAIDLNACSYEGIFINESNIEVNDWTMRYEFEQDCYLNSAWCGEVEIHQKDGEKEQVQRLDLRDFDKKDVTLSYYEVGDIFLFPMKKGDYIVYYPNYKAKEMPIVAIGDVPGNVGIGFIIYWRQDSVFDSASYQVSYTYKKGYTQGREAVICLITSSIWIILLVAGISTSLTMRYMRKKTEMELTQKHNEILNKEVQKQTKQILEMQQRIVLAMADLIENRDNNTGGHVKRTSEIVRILVEEARKQGIMEIDEVMEIDIVRAAPMHDLGKMSIDNSILSKPGKLTEEEYTVMKTHAPKSGEIVKVVLEGVEEEHFVNIAYKLARHHHERWDGKGYPDGLAGTEIPFEARIMAVADVYDALVSKRCYKEAMSFDQAAKIMIECMGSQFDPSLKAVFVASREKLEEYYRNVG